MRALIISWPSNSNPTISCWIKSRPTLHYFQLCNLTHITQVKCILCHVVFKGDGGGSMVCAVGLTFSIPLHQTEILHIVAHQTPYSRAARDHYIPECRTTLWDVTVCHPEPFHLTLKNKHAHTRTQEYPLQLTLWSCIRAAVARTGSVSVVGGTSAAAHVCSACLNSTPRSLQGKVNTSKWPITIYEVSTQWVFCL